MGLPFQIFRILTFCLIVFIFDVFATAHEKQFRSHSLLPISNTNCETARFRTIEDKCYRTHAKYPVKGSCTKFIHCYRNDANELVAKEDECSGGTVYLAKQRSCGFSDTPNTCLQVQCAGIDRRSPSTERNIGFAYANPARKSGHPGCGPEDVQEDEEELEFGRIPCPPGAKTERGEGGAPNWYNRPGPDSTTYSPFNRESNTGQRHQTVSSGYGNREAGRDQQTRYGGNREAGRDQQTRYGGNRGGQDQGQSQGPWQFPAEEPTESYQDQQGGKYTSASPTLPSKYTTAKPNWNSGDNNGYPPYPGNAPQLPTTKKPFYSEQEQKGKDLNNQNNVPGYGQDEEPYEEEPPVQQGHVQNSGLTFVSSRLSILFASFMILAF